MENESSLRSSVSIERDEFFKSDMPMASDLLEDYVSKLRNRCVEFEELSKKRFQSLVLLLLLPGVLIYSALKYDGMHQILIQQMCMLLSLLVASIMIMAPYYYNNISKSKILKTDLATLAKQMTVLVRMVSELENLTRLSPLQRTAMRLKLADAEGALQYVSLLTGKEYNIADVSKPFENDFKIAEPSEPSKPAMLKKQTIR